MIRRRLDLYPDAGEKHHGCLCRVCSRAGARYRRVDQRSQRWDQHHLESLSRQAKQAYSYLCLVREESSWLYAGLLGGHPWDLDQQNLIREVGHKEVDPARILNIGIGAEDANVKAAQRMPGMRRQRCPTT